MSENEEQIQKEQESVYLTELRSERFAKTDAAVKVLLEACAYTGDTDAIECAISKVPGFDFDCAWSILAAVQARLETRYDLDYKEKYQDLLYQFKKLRDELEKQ